MRFYFTFGPGHYDDNIERLVEYYTEIEATSYDDAKEAMNNKRWPHYLLQYTCPKRAKINKLKLIEFKNLTKQNGDTRIEHNNKSILPLLRKERKAS